MHTLTETVSQFWSNIQSSLFPYLEEALGPLTEKQMQLIAILEVIRIEQFLPDYRWYEGRPRKTRAAIARSFVAKMVYNMDTTRTLWERLRSDKNLRKICGWETQRAIPSESTFSRAFAEFAETELPQTVHEAMIKKLYKEQIVLHNSRDSTAIEVREKPVDKQNPIASPAETEKLPRKRGRPQKVKDSIPKEPTRIERQKTMSLKDMLKDLPCKCDVGAKKNSKSRVEYWTGYKLHLDSGDGCVPISAVLTSASTHDSQVAIPLATMSSLRVINLYDLMDAAYDVTAILEHSISLGHIPIVDLNPRSDKIRAREIEAEAKRQKLINMEAPETIRYRNRTNAERVNARLKDDFGGRMVRVRGCAKVMCHLMFGVLALAADQLIKFVT
jgi:transposase